MSGVETILVAREDADCRLDRWFRRHYPMLPHGRLEKLLRTGQIRVDGGRVKASTRLAAGQTVRVPPLSPTPARTSTPTGAAAAAPDRAAPPDPTLARLVLYRDEAVIALDKPPGLAVQGGSGLTRHVDGLLDGLRFGARDRPRLVHRLDKDTSGVLLLGRTPAATARLTAAFRDKTARKLYWALVVGVPERARGRIDLAISKARSGSGERVTAAAPDAKRAITHYAVLEAAGRRATWLALSPQTGRTHQLRVHCAAIGTPVLGDGKYGGRDAFIAGLSRRLHLHARAIEMPHPDGGVLRVTAPLPEAMRATWRFFGFDPEDTRDPFAAMARR